MDTRVRAEDGRLSAEEMMASNGDRTQDTNHDGLRRQRQHHLVWTEENTGGGLKMRALYLSK